MERNTGARGLRSVMEDLLTQVMFDVPSDHTIAKVTITADCVENKAKPELEIDPERKPVKLKAPAKNRNSRRKVTA